MKGFWTTVSVAVLPPGWENVFTEDGGERRYPCPALLIQELKEGYDVETRVVFGDIDGGELCPASEASNYLRTEQADE